MSVKSLLSMASLLNVSNEEIIQIVKECAQESEVLNNEEYEGD